MSVVIINGQEVRLTKPEDIQRLRAEFPKNEDELIPYLPTPEEERDLVEQIQKRLPYLVITYAADLVSYIPGVGSLLAKAITWVIDAKYKGTVTQKKIF